MKILPEHETLFTIMSKLIQVVWITFELPMDEIDISNTRNEMVNKKSTIRAADDDDQEHHLYDGAAWNSISPASSSSSPSSMLSSTSFQNINHEDNSASSDLRLVDKMMIERDVPCRATGILARGVYWYIYIYLTYYILYFCCKDYTHVCIFLIRHI